MHLYYQINACVQEITATFIQKKTIHTEKYSVHNQQTAPPTSSKAEKRPQYRFPVSTEENDSILCEYERIIKIYNKYNNDNRKKLTGTMEQWFLDKAKQCGWADAKFFRCDGSTKKACLLFKLVVLESAYVSKH